MDVVIIGCGFSGSQVCVNLIEQSPGPCRIAVIDQSGLFAKGPAYSTLNPHHFLNVMAARMGAFHQRPEDFALWLEKNQRPYSSEDYVPRKVYGEYLEELLEQAKKTAKKKGIELTFLVDEAVDVLGNKVLCKSGKEIQTKALVLAMGMFPQENFQSARYTKNIWDSTRKSEWEDVSTLGIIGSGLTMVDAVIAVLDEGFSGNILVFSTHGQLPLVHREEQVANPVFPTSLRALFRLIRQQPYSIDALRPHVPRLWEQFSLKEKKQFMRHVLSLWNKYRHRIAPQSFSLFKQASVQFIAEKVRSLRANGSKVAVVGEKTYEVDHVINCSGPAFSIEKTKSPLMKNLLAKKLVKPDLLGLGIQVDPHYKVIHEEGLSMYALGQILFGQKLETTAVPELRAQVDVIVTQLMNLALN